MDKGQQQNGVGVQKGGYKPSLDQTQSRPSMRDIMAIISERDAALLERNLALSEKKSALQERDMAVLERDAAIVERDNAIKERDEVISHLQLFENFNGTDEGQLMV